MSYLSKIAAFVFMLSVYVHEHSVFAQSEPICLDDILQAGEQWLEENIDPDVLRIMGDMDQARARKFMRDFQQWLQSEYVADVTSIRETASIVLPLLEKY